MERKKKIITICLRSIGSILVVAVGILLLDFPSLMALLRNKKSSPNGQKYIQSGNVKSIPSQQSYEGQMTIYKENEVVEYKAKTLSGSRQTIEKEQENFWVREGFENISALIPAAEMKSFQKGNEFVLVKTENLGEKYRVVSIRTRKDQNSPPIPAYAREIMYGQFLMACFRPDSFPIITTGTPQKQIDALQKLKQKFLASNWKVDFVNEKKGAENLYIAASKKTLSCCAMITHGNLDFPGLNVITYKFSNL